MSGAQGSGEGKPGPARQKPAVKRKHPRVDMEIPAEVADLADGGRRYDATVGNLGPEGAYVKSCAKIEQGAKVRLSFKISSHPLPIECDAEVRWAREGAGGGLGVHFLDCPPFERAAIDDFCQYRIEESRGAGGGGGGD